MGEAKRRGTYEERVKKSNFICIICREEKIYTLRSDEHVIPDSLNGYYHIYNVCKTCNSNMGASVDGVFLNHKLTQLYRYVEQIKGKSGSIPNPFKEVRGMKEQPETKVKTEIKDGEIITKYIQNVSFEKNEDGSIRSFHITVDASDEHKLEGIKKNIIKKYGLEESNFKTTIQSNKVDKPVLEGTWEVDTHKYKMGLLKIAYEFAVDSIPEYFNDVTAIQISKILKDADYEELDNLKISNGFKTDGFNFVEDFIDLDKKRHILMLLSFEDALICFIKIDNLMQLAVQLSSVKYYDLIHSVIGINDLEEKVFYKKTFHQFINSQKSKRYQRFIYFIPNNISGEKLLDIKTPNFKQVESKKGIPKLYDKFGNSLPFSLHGLLNRSPHVRTFANNEMTVNFTFPKNLSVYIRSLQTGNLFQVIGYESSEAFFKI